MGVWNEHRESRARPFARFGGGDERDVGRHKREAVEPTRARTPVPYGKRVGEA
jgi:hypothetical protein